MALCPRRQAGSILRHPDQDEEMGIVELNGTLLAGTAMVKTREEWTFLRGGEGRLDGVLRDVGFTSSDNEHEEEGVVEKKMSRRGAGEAKEIKI